VDAEKEKGYFSAAVNFSGGPFICLSAEDVIISVELSGRECVPRADTIPKIPKHDLIVHEANGR